jgi:hypothetical protein
VLSAVYKGRYGAAPQSRPRGEAEECRGSEGCEEEAPRRAVPTTTTATTAVELELLAPSRPSVR